MHGIRSLIEISIPGGDHHPFSALPPHICDPTLVLELFRGEPAIAEFDWNFSASHSSSLIFAIMKRSAFHEVLPPLRPGHG